MSKKSKKPKSRRMREQQKHWRANEPGGVFIPDALAQLGKTAATRTDERTGAWHG